MVVQKERERPAAELKEPHEAVKEAEELIRMLPIRPAPAMAIDNAEKAMGEVIRVGKRIDEKIGLSEEQERRRQRRPAEPVAKEVPRTEEELMQVATLVAEFRKPADELKEATMTWSPAMAEQKRVVDDALRQVESLAKEGRVDEAEKGLAMAAMYADSAARLDRAEKQKLDGMGLALAAMKEGRGELEGRSIESVFLESFKESQSAAVAKEAARLEQTAAKRPIGLEGVTAALESAKEKAEKSDFGGANILLQYIRDYYRMYGLIASIRTPAATRARDKMLEAIGNEAKLKPGEPGDAEAAALFDSAAKKMAAEAILSDYRNVRNLYEGKAPFVPELGAGKVPLGVKRKDGTWPHLELREVAEYESSHPADGALKKGEPLRPMLERLERAALSGKTGEYEKTRTAFWERFSLVVSRVQREKIVKELRDTQGSLQEIFSHYAGEAYGAAELVEARKNAADQSISAQYDYLLERYGRKEGHRIDELVKLDAEMSDILESRPGAPQYTKDMLENTTTPLPMERIEAAIGRSEDEGRIGLAHSQVVEQLKLNAEYRRMLEGRVASLAKTPLDASRELLEEARELLLKGQTPRAVEAFDNAMKYRVQAMAVYEAKNALTFARTGAPLRETVEAAITGRGEHPEYADYLERQKGVIRGVLYGGIGSKEIDEKATGARIIEASVFATPADKGSQLFADYTSEQEKVRDLVKAGKLEEADNIFTKMQTRVADNEFWTSVGVGAGGLLITLFSGGLGSALFTTMAADQVVSEYRVTGTTTWWSWASLGLVVITTGIGGAASMFGAEAKTAMTTEYAASMARWSKGFSWAGLGIGAGFSLSMGNESLSAFAEGRDREGIFLAAMALFPMAHMAGARLRAGLGKRMPGRWEAEARRIAAREEAVPRRVPEELAAALRKPEIAPEAVREVQKPLERLRIAAAAKKAKEAMPAEALMAVKEYLKEETNLSGVALNDPIARQILSRSAAPAQQKTEWLVGGERIRVGGIEQEVTTGKIISTIESWVTRIAEGGKDTDVIVITSDKRMLNLVNNLLGWDNGTLSLLAYREMLGRAIVGSAGEGAPYLVRPSQSGDEVIGIIITPKGRGAAVREKLGGALERSTAEVLSERMRPEHDESISHLRQLVRNPRDLIAAAVETSQVVEVRKQPDGRVTARYADGRDAMITRPDGKREFLPAVIRETDDPKFAPELRQVLGARAETEIRSKLEAAEERKIADAYARRKEALGPEERAFAAGVEQALLKHGLDASEPAAVSKAINMFAKERVEVQPGEVIARESTAFEIRLGIPDPGVLANVRGRLAEAGKGLAEVLRNSFGIRGLNTFIGHYGANHVVNEVEAAVGAYAAQRGVVIRKLGTMKYLMEGGRPEQVAGLHTFINESLQRNGLVFRVSEKSPAATVKAGTTGRSALAEVSNGHIMLDRRQDPMRRTDWDGEEKRYQQANALISAMTIGNDEMLIGLLGKGSYEKLRPTMELIRGRRDIRNFEDLVTALREPSISGRLGPDMESAFRGFIIKNGDMFVRKIGAFVKRPELRSVEAEEAMLRAAAGAE